MKININKWTLLCKDQNLKCDNCLFEKTNTCIYYDILLNNLCTKLDIIYVKHSSSDLFKL